MRLSISLQGYGLGLLLSLIFVVWNYRRPSGKNLSTNTVVCISGTITFLTHYFYYILSPKSDWMLNHLKTREQNKAWLKIYRTMSWNYHISMLFGVLSALVLGRIFKCTN
jgi:hypothetical protein